MAGIARSDATRHVRAMRSPLLLLALAVAGCATTPPGSPLETPVAEVSLPAPAAPPSAALRLLRSASHDANAPTREEVVRVLGEPAIARQDGVGAALTYRLETCALLLLFEADAQNTHRLTMVNISPRQPGAPAPSLEQCAAEVRAR